MNRRSFSVPVGAILVPLLGACAGLLDPAVGEREIPLIALPSEEPTLSVPQRVTVGLPFEVHFVTYGSASCTRADGAEVRVSGMVAEVTPYDRPVRGAGMCTAELRRFWRTASVRFQSEGEAVVRLIGGGMGPGGMIQHEVRTTVVPAP